MIRRNFLTLLSCLPALGWVKPKAAVADGFPPPEILPPFIASRRYIPVINDAQGTLSLTLCRDQHRLAWYGFRPHRGPVPQRIRERFKDWPVDWPEPPDA